MISRKIGMAFYKMNKCSQPDVACAVTTWNAHLMTQCWSIWLSTEIDQEVMVHLQPTQFRVHIHKEQLTTLFLEFWVELGIPRTEETSGDVKTLPIQRELNHLR